VDRITVEVLPGRGAIESLAEEWDRLVEGSEGAAFSCPAWYLAWIDAFRPKEIAMITARQEGRLAGVLPLGRVRTDARGLYFRLLSPFAVGDYQPPIVDPQIASAALRTMLDAAFVHYGHGGVLWWPNFPCHDPGYEMFHQYMAERGMCYAEELEAAARFRLNGMDFAAVERGWHGKHRIDVRRRRRKLAEEVGPASIWQPATIEEAEPVLEEFFQVYDERWLVQGYPGRFGDARERLHYRCMLRRMWGHGLHFSTVRCGGQDISYHFGFFAGGWLQWYRPTYRASFSKYGPSKVHIAMLLEEACRSQWNGIDFLLGAEDWKEDWCNESVTVARVHAAFRPWLPAYWWFTRGKPWARERLAGQYMRVRGALRKWRAGA